MDLKSVIKFQQFRLNIFVTGVVLKKLHFHD